MVILAVRADYYSLDATCRSVGEFRRGALQCYALEALP